jgi:hypothetical protein
MGVLCLQESGEVDADFAMLDPRDIITKDLDELRLLALEKKEKQAEKSTGALRHIAGLGSGLVHVLTVQRSSVWPGHTVQTSIHCNQHLLQDLHPDTCWYVRCGCNRSAPAVYAVLRSGGSPAGACRKGP